MHPSIEHRAARFRREHGGGGGAGSGSTKVSIERVLAGRVDLDDGAISGLVVGFFDEAEDSPRSIDAFVNVDWPGAQPGEPYINITAATAVPEVHRRRRRRALSPRW